MHRIIKQVAAALALVPLFVLSGCSGGAPVYVAGVETEMLPEDKTGNDSHKDAGADSLDGSLEGADEVKALPREDDVSAVQDGYGDSEETGIQRGAGYVYVCGAVVTPGVYPINPGMRVFEAIALAGGFSQKADEEWLNQAQTVQDGQRLYVYSKEETQQMQQEGTTVDGDSMISADMGTGMEASGASGTSVVEDGTKININTADRETLMTLPGIGEAKAEAVIQYRTEHGSFTSIEEIQNISGIKTAVFSKIRDLITV